MDITFTNDIFILNVYKLEAVDNIKCADGRVTTEKMLIGFFDSLDSCDKVENDYKNLPGFSLPSCKFKRTPYAFASAKQSNIEQVFYAEACMEHELTGEETVTEIGLYLSQNEAATAIERYVKENDTGIPSEQLKKSGAVYVEEYKINQRHWQEGFTRYTWIAEG